MMGLPIIIHHGVFETNDNPTLRYCPLLVRYFDRRGGEVCTSANRRDNRT